ncbi:MAG: LON peptidase substrate-binding domain-containing protein [Deltaproteobacteria bacterium]|nr:LON peptidase substrate-binding domain-containing protein [Deltaproteobacteria bacterium]
MQPPKFFDAIRRLPIFPLPQVVFFPEAVLPLHVFEPRYRAMLRDCITTHGAMAIAQIVPGEDDHGRPRIAEVAAGGIIIEHQPLPDGRANIVLRGVARLRLEELEPSDGLPYRIARATILHDREVQVPEHDRTALVAAATMFAAEVKKHDPNFTFRLPKALEAPHLADLCAFQLIVDASARQAVLEELDPRARVTMVLDQLAMQHGAMMKTDDSNRVLN